MKIDALVDAIAKDEADNKDPIKSLIKDLAIDVPKFSGQVLSDDKGFKKEADLDGEPTKR